ncbi:cleavage and polyadenylation specificity factor subunit 2 [Angomonas deanei]|nr:cleavage and polyadenylation specificity factor subunit 2 [Angomonas deanei]|eukprot:EPY35145.1 cleavage and polyadenylation specificity factor subunit 2 [Angomonas deanei]
MTEVLKNDVMLSEETLFSTVLPCKTAEEVLSIRTPKVCVADGANLDYGIAAELVKPVCQNENSIVLFTSNPKQDTNASNILLNHETMGDFDLRYVRRSRLDREELEEYYRQLEHESELERQRLEMEGAFEVVKEDDDMDLDEDEAGSPKEKKATLVPGLYLPSYVNPPSRKFLNFPLLESNTAAHSNNDDYGLPISEEERNLLKQRAPAQAIIDNLKDLDLVNDAQQDAKIPSKIVTVVETVSLQCKVLSSDLSGLVDAHAFKHIVASKLYVARKIVSIRGSAEDWRSFTNYCRMEKSLKCGDNIFNATAGLSIELATQVFSYVVNLEPQLFTNLSGGQSRVRERNTDDVWEVNWVDGVIRTEEEDGTPIDLKRQRFEAGDLSLATVDAEDTQKCAEYKEKHGFFKGSYFFGEVELPQLRDTSRRTNHLNCEMHKKAPLLVYDDGVCVRKTDTQNGTVLTMSSVTTPNMFTVRQSLYKQFSQII